MVAWWHGCIVAWLLVGLVAWWHGVMVAWWHDGLVAWWHGDIVTWWHGNMVAWWHGGVIFPLQVQARLREIKKKPHIGRHWGKKKIICISDMIDAKRKQES
jgi:hypothetical protein